MVPARPWVRSLQADSALRKRLLTTHATRNVTARMISGITSCIGSLIRVRRKASNPLLICSRFAQNKLGARPGPARRHFDMGTRVSILLLMLACCLPAQEPTAPYLYTSGRKAERAGQMAVAYLRYSLAAAMAPTNKTYWLRSQAVRTRAAIEAGIVSSRSSAITSQ